MMGRDLLYSIVMLAVAVLTVGGIRLLRKGGDNRKQGWLMLGAALVMLLNVLIWTL